MTANELTAIVGPNGIESATTVERPPARRSWYWLGSEDDPQVQLANTAQVFRENFDLDAWDEYLRGRR